MCQLAESEMNMDVARERNERIDAGRQQRAERGNGTSRSRAFRGSVISGCQPKKRQWQP